MAVIDMQLARAHEGLQDHAAVGKAYREALAIYRELRRRNPKSDRSLDDLASAGSMMGHWLKRRGRDGEAVEQLTPSRAVF